MLGGILRTLATECGYTDKVRPIDNDRFPEWRPFVDAVQQRRPDAGTWCEAWTVRDIVAHQAGNAEELARVLGAHLEGEPVGTRGFEEREGPLRALNDADLWDALQDRMVALNEVAAAADEVPADTDVGWTGRTMKAPWFAEHMREELVLHGWDITGDDPEARARLAKPRMTTHSVVAVGRPLLAKGAKELGPGERIEARLRVTGTDDVVRQCRCGSNHRGVRRTRGAGDLGNRCCRARIAAVGTTARRPVADLQPRRRRNLRPGAAATQRLLSCSVVVADAGDLLDKSDVCLSLWHCLHLLGHLRALRRRGCQELTQVALRYHRLVELRGGSRIGCVKRCHHLPVVTGGVDDTIHGICGRDPGSNGQRQCQTANRGGEFGQRRPNHVWTPSPTNAPPKRR